MLLLLPLVSCDRFHFLRTQVGASPAVGVFWLTHAEAMPPAEQCARVRAMQEALPWMRAGTDFIDLSHIVCNGTAAA